MEYFEASKLIKGVLWFRMKILLEETLVEKMRSEKNVRLNGSLESHLLYAATESCNFGLIRLKLILS